MGILDRILGRPESEADQGATSPPAPPARDADEVAVERYRYLLRTAPPEALEQAHAEAFASLTPEQRRRVLTELSGSVPEAERATSDDPQALARMATRAEMRRPGTMERTFGGGGAGGMGGMGGMGGLFAGTLLASIAGSFIGTSIAGALLSDYGDPAEAGAGDGADAGGADEGDPGADAGAGEAGGGDDMGGDMGGADMGVGDFGGGDFGGDYAI